MTEPSSFWWVSRIATIARVTAVRVPLRVATGVVEPSTRVRMSRRRAWKSVQLEVEVSSPQPLRVGIHASQSNLRTALSPRSPAAVSMMR